MATPELIPVVDLRLLSQADIHSLSLSSPSSFDLHSHHDVVVPKIDRSVFNESAGSRKQTYSRLRLAPRQPHPQPQQSPNPSLPRRRGRPRLYPPSPQPAPSAADEEDRKENLQIVAHLRRLFSQHDQTLILAPTPAPVPAPAPAPLQTLAPVSVDERDKELVNSRGEVVDLVELGLKEDPYGEEMRRRTEGLRSEEQLLGFMTGLDGQWGSRRRRRKIVDAAGFGEHLPRGWSLLLGLKRKEGVAWLNCRRYISPSGRQFMSCKEVSCYILSLVGQQGSKEAVSTHHDETASQPDRSNAGLTHQDGITRQKSNCSFVAPISYIPAGCSNQGLLFKLENPAAPELKNVLECHECNISFGDVDAHVQHMSTFHQRSAKRRRVGKSIGDGVIVKDGKYECQYCHKTFSERHRYNGHIGAHVRYQGLGAEASSNGIATENSTGPPSMAVVPYGSSDVNVLISNNEDTCTASSVNDLQVGPSQCTLMAENHDFNDNQINDASETTETNSTRKSVNIQTKDCGATYKSNEDVEASNDTDNIKSHACTNVQSPCLIGVNYAAQDGSANISQEASTSKYVDLEMKDCTTTGDKSKAATDDSNLQGVEACLDSTTPTPADVGGAFDKSVDDIGPSSVGKYAYDSSNDFDLADYEPEEIINTSNDMQTETNACVDALQPSAVNVDNTIYENSNEVGLPSNTVTSAVEQHCEVQGSENHIITLSGETYTNSFFRTAMGEHVEFDPLSSEKRDGGSFHTLNNNIGIDVTMNDELNASCVITSFENEHNFDTEAKADGMFPEDMNKSAMPENEPTHELKNYFNHSNAACDEDVTVDMIDDAVRGNALQLDAVNSSSSWVQSPPHHFPILHTVTNQREGDLRSISAKHGHENLLDFEEVRLGNIPTEFDLLSGQELQSESETALELGYTAQLERSPCSSIQLDWGIHPSNIGTREGPIFVCVWCSAEFCQEEGTDAEPESGSLGYMCPTCKAKSY